MSWDPRHKPSKDFKELTTALDFEKRLEYKVKNSKVQKFRSYKGVPILGNRGLYIMATDGQAYTHHEFKKKFLNKQADK